MLLEAWFREYKRIIIFWPLPSPKTFASLIFCSLTISATIVWPLCCTALIIATTYSNEYRECAMHDWSLWNILCLFFMNSFEDACLVFITNRFDRHCFFFLYFIFLYVNELIYYMGKCDRPLSILEVLLSI